MVLTKTQKDRLVKEYEQTKYVTEKRKKELARELKLPDITVKVSTADILVISFTARTYGLQKKGSKQLNNMKDIYSILF